MTNPVNKLAALAFVVLSFILIPSSRLLAQDDSTPEEVTLAGVTVKDGGNYEIHTHGGVPANVGAVYLKIEGDDESHLVMVKKIILLDRHCREDEWGKGTPLEPVELHFEPDSGDRVESKDASPVEISGSGRLYATFAAQQVYNACDAFAFAVTLEIDGETGKLEVPLEVIREEPAPPIP